MSKLDDVGFLGFDVFGTVVDWRSGVARAAESFLRRHQIDIDPLEFADQWRSLYQPSMDRVRSGQRPFVTLDVLNKENLETVLLKHSVDYGRIAEAELAQLNKAWEQLDPWPDSVAGLGRLKRKYSIGPLSNGHIAGMLNLSKFAQLPWDVIVGAEVAQSYKPQPQTYLKSAQTVGLPPERVGMVAAHNSDLAAARVSGLKTIFVRRPTEHGPDQASDLTAEQDWDVVAESMTEAADALGC